MKALGFGLTVYELDVRDHAESRQKTISDQQLRGHGEHGNFSCPVVIDAPADGVLEDVATRLLLVLLGCGRKDG